MTLERRLGVGGLWSLENKLLRRPQEAEPTCCHLPALCLPRKLLKLRCLHSEMMRIKVLFPFNPDYPEIILCKDFIV